MKKNILLLSLGLLAAFAILINLGKHVQTNTQQASVIDVEALSEIRSNASYDVDKESSQIRWYAKKVTGAHDGSVELKEAKLEVNGKTITGGSFVVDMGTIKVLDIKDKDTNAKLKGHLDSEDFFAVEKYKESSFKIKNVKAKKSDKGNHEITGDLTIKGKTNEITFPANVYEENGVLKAEADITFDRTKYNVRYGSGSFFDNLGDNVIYDDVNLKVTLVSSK